MTNSFANRSANQGSRLGRCLLAVAVLASLAACDDDIVEPDEGLRVSGTVFYEGEGFDQFVEPVLQVAVFARFPPISVPHGLTIVPDPVFSAEGIDYEITGVPAYDQYHVVAQISDQTDLDDTSGPVGAFPDFCALSVQDGGTVTVTEDAPTTDLDITLYDGGGTQDPCVSEVDTDTCPASEGRASMVIDVASALDTSEITEADNLVVALFTSPEGGAPAAFTLVSGANLEFPQQVIFNNLTPMDYVVFACYDRNGDNLMDCQEGNDENDRFAFWNESGFVTTSADTITTIGLDVDDATSTGPENQSASEAGCQL